MSESPLESVRLAVWDWDHPARAGGRAGAADLRRTGLVQATVLGLVGAVLFFVWQHRVVALVAWGLAAVAALLSLLAPRALGPWARLGRRLGAAGGVLVSWLLIVPLWLLLFTPVALALRLAGRDPLRRPARTAATFWCARRRATAPDEYRRQFLVEERS